eukprot:gene6379-13743_t
MRSGGALLLAPVLFAAAAAAAAAHYEVYVTECIDPSRCSDAGAVAALTARTRRAQPRAARSGSGVADPSALPLALAKLTYSAERRFVRRDLLTGVQKGMAYTTPAG